MRLSISTWTLVAAMATTACGGSSALPGSPTSDLRPVVAPPPPGVSPAVWRIGFVGDGPLVLIRPDEVRVSLSAEADEETRALFASAVAEVTRFIEGKTPIDLVASPRDANFQVLLTPGVTCGAAREVAACTEVRYSPLTGKILGGELKFASQAALHHRTTVVKEIVRALGVLGNSPIPGLLSATAAQAWPTEEERRMLLGRYEYPLLAVYAAQ